MQKTARVDGFSVLLNSQRCLTVKTFLSTLLEYFSLAKKIKNIEFFPKTCLGPTHFSSEQNHKSLM